MDSSRSLPACIRKVPIMLHFAELDKHIPKERSDAVQAANPD
jgi:dienelactone hydrolase